MMMRQITHNIEDAIQQDIHQKMVFLTGPRQVGKTTLAQKIIRKNNGKYLFYDDDEDRRIILKKQYLHEKLVCLDELHKYQRWKNYLKGVYDKNKDHLKLIVTGSARLDIYQKSGDSLFGRFYLHYLHPLSLAELNQNQISLPENFLEPHPPLKGIDELLHYSGFPEPFLSSSDRTYRRWANQRQQLLIHEDLRELSQIQLISLAENLMLLLPERAGTLISCQSLAEDLRVSIPTIQKWMAVFERLFLVYPIKPYTTHITRSLTKRPKYYLWDWCQIQSPGYRFENLVASHLFKAVSIWNALGLTNAQLHFIRTRNGDEVDFLVTKDQRPWFLVEVKLAEEKISPQLIKYSQKFQIPAIQLVLKSNVYRKEGAICIISADQWLGKLA